MVLRSIPVPASDAQKAAKTLGLLQPLEKLSLDQETLDCTIEWVVEYCDEHGADHITDLVKRARMLIPRACPTRSTTLSFPNTGTCWSRWVIGGGTFACKVIRV